MGRVPIPGTERVPYMQEDVAAAHVVLSPEKLRRIADAVAVGDVVGERYGDMSHIDT